MVGDRSMELEISTQVSLWVQGPDVARIHEAHEELRRNVPAEADTQTFGAGTVAVLKAIQTDLGIPATGIVDSEEDSRQPRRRRTVTGYHGTHGDAILGILRR